jgi:hypothetical protein
MVGLLVCTMTTTWSWAQSGYGENIQIRQGSNFRYALPAGWQVGEEGSGALVLNAPDGSASVVVIGISGLMQHLSPEQFAAYAFNQMRFSNVQAYRSQPAQPASGCAAASVIEVSFVYNGKPWHALVLSNVAHGYAQCNGALTIAMAQEQVWDAHKNWLPQVAAQAVNTGPNAYGSTQVAVVNQHGAQQLGQQLQDQRNWSANLQAQVQADHDRSWRNQSYYMGQMLTGNGWYQNPYGGSPTYQSTYPAVRWSNPNGSVVTSANPTYDPRTPTDQDWRRMQQQTPDD